MSERDLASEPPRLGCLFALTLIALPGLALSVLIEPLAGEEWPFALFWGVIFALPFGYLALATKAWVPWAVTSILTTGVWGALIATVFVGAQEQQGVNFGVALLMLAAPIIITAVAATAVHFSKGRP